MCIFPLRSSLAIFRGSGRSGVAAFGGRSHSTITLFTMPGFGIGEQLDIVRRTATPLKGDIVT